MDGNFWSFMDPDLAKQQCRYAKIGIRHTALDKTFLKDEKPLIYLNT